MIEIKTNASQNSFIPGATVTGTVHWHLKKEPSSVEINLIWHTAGIGTEDNQLAASKSASKTALRKVGSADFSFKLPTHPWSFSGELVSLIWAIEVVIEPDLALEELKLLMTPELKEIELGRSS